MQLIAPLQRLGGHHENEWYQGISPTSVKDPS